MNYLFDLQFVSYKTFFDKRIKMCLWVVQFRQFLETDGDDAQAFATVLIRARE